MAATLNTIGSQRFKIDMRNMSEDEKIKARKKQKRMEKSRHMVEEEVDKEPMSEAQKQGQNIC